jgi:hypothetical protein
MYRRFVRRSLLTIAAVIALGSTSQAAARLSTPQVGANAGQVLDCVVTNVSTKPAAVAVTFLDVTGGAETPSVDQCTGFPLAAGASCQVVLPADTQGRCVVVADTGKIRAAIEVFGPSPSPLVTEIAATK